MNKKMVLALASVYGLFAQGALAANFSVSPLRLDLAGNKSTSVTVTNDGDKPLDLSIEAMTWTQDDKAVDHHEKTDALSFYPAAMTLAPKSKRTIRVSTKPGEPRPAVEAAYRLYITELPEAHAAHQGEAVALEMRFGLPVFVYQAKASPQLSATTVSGGSGMMHITLNNSGNAHARIESISSKPEGINASKFDQWYVLAGASNTYHLAVPPALCQQAGGKIVLEARADARVIPVNVTLPPETCSGK
jgi:P pilus assembly chaperone PapD